jgi:predicted nucleic acid-binding protein
VKPAVLDSSAVLALLFDEPGASVVQDVLGKLADAGGRPSMTAVNWAEVSYIVQRKRGQQGLDAARHFAQATGLDIVSVDRSAAERAAELKAIHSLGLADAFAAALALDNRFHLITGDREFEALAGKITIHWLK